MEDSNKVVQDKSELDLSCCFSSKFILPSSLLEDDDEVENQNYEISLKRNLNPLKKYSSSTCISAFSNNSSQVFNRNLDRSSNFKNDVNYLNRNNLNEFGAQFMSGNMIGNDQTNLNSLRSNLSEFPNSFPKAFQKKRTFSYLENKNLEVMDGNFEDFNQNFHSPQIYPSNFQESINTNMMINKMNNLNMNFANYYRNNSENNNNHNHPQFNQEIGNMNVPLGFRKNPEDTLDIFHINRNNFNDINQLSRRMSQPINQNLCNNNIPNFGNINFNPMSKTLGQKSNFNSSTSAKKNFGYDFVQDMAKLNINNPNRKSDNSNVPKSVMQITPTQILPFGIQNPVTTQTQTPTTQLINPIKGIPQSLTPAFPPRKITKHEINERNDRRLNSHNLKNKLMLGTILEESIENATNLQEGSLNNFLKTIDGNIIPYLKTQKGSRSMQKFMNSCSLNSECVETLFIKIYPHAKELMTDNYGNYFMQKLIQFCTGSQKMLLLKHIYNDFLEVACNPSGTHSIQSIIETISLREEEEIIRECVENHMLILCRNSNGTHIMQKIILCIPEENRHYINNFIVDNICNLSMNVNGVCVVKKFMNYNKNILIRDSLIQNLERNSLEIVQDPYGNYAIQYAMEYYGINVCVNLINTIVSNIVILSNQKFASNVVEKCIDFGSESLFRIIITEMFLVNQNFLAIMKNKYGNFVLIKAIKTMNPELKLEVKSYLLKNVTVNCGKERTKLNYIIDQFC